MVKKNNRQKGQALLIVVLVMVVALTVGLAVISRSITSLRTSTEQANSQQALSAAEAGIAQSLKPGVGNVASLNIGNGASYDTKVSSVNGASMFLVNEGQEASKDEGVDIWLVNHDASGNPDYSKPWPQPPGSGTLTIYWGEDSSGCNDAALEIVAISGTALSPTSTRYAYDPCSSRGNNFKPPVSIGGTGQNISDKTFYYDSSINFDSSSGTGGLIVRVIPLYANAAIGVWGGGTINLPSQGSNISSTGKAGGTVRKINVFQGYPLLPAAFFTSGIFSPKI